MKKWVLVLISASAPAWGILASPASAQTQITAAPPANMSHTNSTQTILGASSIVVTNPAFHSSFQSKAGVQIATTTNVPLGIPSQRKLGAPSIVETNLSFGSSFQGRTGRTTTTNAPLGISSQNQPGAPPTTGTNTVFRRSFQSNIGELTAPATNFFTGPATSSVIGAQTSITNFLVSSSSQSWIGQGRGVFATPTNGYDIRLTEVSPSILEFNISATDSVATNWLLRMSTTNDFFTVGVYSNAVNAGGSPARLVFGGMGRGDNSSDGFFNVLEATYSSNQIVSFAADFVQYDNDNTNSWNEGSIRYNSTIPDSVNLWVAPVAIVFQKGNAVLTWSTNLAGFQLEYATNLPTSVWFTNISAPSIVNGQYTVTMTNGVSAGTGTHFYRLMKRL